MDEARNEWAFVPRSRFLALRQTHYKLAPPRLPAGQGE